MSTTAEGAGAPVGWKAVLTRPVMSWALYDLANTIFSMNIVSLYLSLWVLNVMGGTDATWGYANSLAMVMVFLSAPILGALSDQAGRRLPFLMVCTIACVGFTAALGTGGLMMTLVFFVIANYFFQASLIFYDATLSVVSTPQTRGIVGGFGVGIGYLGSFTGVLTGLLLLDRIGYVGVFRVTAVLFLLFAVPIFLFVREPKRPGNLRLDPGAIGRALRQVKDTIGHLPRYPGLARFLVGRVFYTDAANTVIIFLGIYTVNEIGFTETGAQVLLLVAITSAVVGGLGLGMVVDRIGPKHTLNMVLALWAVALVGAVAVPVLGLPMAWFWLIACIAGIALGGDVDGRSPVHAHHGSPEEARGVLWTLQHGRALRGHHRPRDVRVRGGDAGPRPAGRDGEPARLDRNLLPHPQGRGRRGASVGARGPGGSGSLGPRKLVAGLLRLDMHLNEHRLEPGVRPDRIHVRQPHERRYSESTEVDCPLQCGDGRVVLTDCQLIPCQVDRSLAQRRAQSGGDLLGLPGCGEALGTGHECGRQLRIEPSHLRYAR